MINEIDKKKNKVAIFFTEFIRIRHVLGWSLISFGGFIVGMTSLNLNDYIIPLLVFVVSTFFIMSFTFAINNYYDVDTDIKNPRRMNFNAIASGKFTKKTGIYLNILFVIITLVVSFLFKFEVFLFCAFLLFLGWSYSAPPLRTKNIPVLDVIWHFLLFFFYILWGSLVAGSIDLINWLAAISVGVFSTVGQIENHIYDYSFDKKSGTMTFAVWAGLEKAKTTLKIVTIFHLILLIPLILLYTISYIITIFLAFVVVIMVFINLTRRKDALTTQMFFVRIATIGIGGGVYLSILVYHLCFLINQPTLSILNCIINL